MRQRFVESRTECENRLVDDAIAWCSVSAILQDSISHFQSDYWLDEHWFSVCVCVCVCVCKVESVVRLTVVTTNTARACQRRPRPRVIVRVMLMVWNCYTTCCFQNNLLLWEQNFNHVNDFYISQGKCGDSFQVWQTYVEILQDFVYQQSVHLRVTSNNTKGDVFLDQSGCWNLTSKWRVAQTSETEPMLAIWRLDNLT